MYIHITLGPHTCGPTAYCSLIAYLRPQCVSAAPPRTAAPPPTIWLHLVVQSCSFFSWKKILIISTLYKERHNVIACDVVFANSP